MASWLLVEKLLVRSGRRSACWQGLYFSHEDVILVRYRKTIKYGREQCNLFGSDPAAHPSPCGEGADLRAGNYRGTGTPWLPLERRDPLSIAARIGTRRLPALFREKERPACPPSVQGHAQGPPVVARGENQSPRALRRTL